MKNKKSQYDKMGEDYVNSQRRYFALTPSWARAKIFKGIGNAKGKSILDIGCGAGYEIKLLEQKGAVVYGVDPSKKMVELAKNNVSNSSRIFVGSYEEVKSPNNKFDVVIGKYSLHYLKNFDKAYKEIARVMKKGGKLLLTISDPTFNSYVKAISKDKNKIEVKIYNGKVAVQFPPHEFKDYFSPTFFKLFSLEEIDQNLSDDTINPLKLPDSFYFKATKK